MMMSNVNNSRSYTNEENKQLSSPTKKQVIRDTIGQVKNTKEFTLGNQPPVNKSPLKNQGSNLKRKIEKQGNSLQTSISSSNIQAQIDPLMIGRNTIPLKKLQDLTLKSQQNPLLQKQQASNDTMLREGPSTKQSTSALSKNYKYWIDIQDLHSVLLFVLSHFTINNDRGDSVDQDLSHSIIIEDLKLDQDQLQFLRSFAHSDFESRSVLKSYLNEHKNVNLNEVFDANQCWIYLIENAKVITQVYKNKSRSDIVAALKMINQQIEQYQCKYQKKTLRLCFSGESELYTILVKILGAEMVKNIQVRKICQVLYEACLKFREQQQDNLKPILIMKSYVFIKLELYTRGRDVFDQQQNSYPLHKAVFDQNLPLISRYVKGQYEGSFFQDKNSIDPCGNTPLILAVKLGHIDTIKVLCDLTCCPKLKSLHNFPCALDVASSVKVKEIIKILLEANQKIKQHYLEMNKEAMFRALESLPDFKLDMNFQVQSNFIPFIGSIAPSDTYKIYKMGSKLRLDMTLVGFKNLKSIRGNLSVLFKGRQQDNEGELFVVDHDTKNVTNIFNQVVGAKLDKDLEDIMADEQYQKMYKADQFQMEPVIEGRTGQVMHRMIEGFAAEKYKMKTTFTMTKYKIDIGQVQSIKQYRDFQEYIDSARKNNFGIDKTIQDEEDIMVDKKIFNSTAPGPLQFQRANSQERSNPNLPTFTQNETSSLNTLMGLSSNNKKTTKKTINASIWLCNKYPLSLDSFLPLLQVLSFSSKQIAKFKDYLMKYQLPQGSFPLRAKIPIFFTMKAAFSLQNLSLNPSDLTEDLFNIDQNYLSSRILLIQQNQPSQIVAANLNDIYNMIKTSPQDDDEEDLESIQRANDMFNSMIRKEEGKNQQEHDLLFQSNNNEPSQLDLSLADNPLPNQQHLQSFHSEMDSMDLSERQVNDGKVKVAAHAFSQIQTMNEINGRHEGTEDTLNAKNEKLIISRTKIQLVGQHGRNQKNDLLNIRSGVSKKSSIEGENLFDTKYPEEKPLVNATSVKRMITKMQKPPLIAQPITPSGSISILSQTGKQDLASTLKSKAFNQKHQLKNYKNLIKYSVKIDKPLIKSESSSYGGQSFRTGEESQGATIVLEQRGSTADNSIATIIDQSSSMITGMKWFKQIIEYKNAFLGQKEAPGYLQTIESEEILPTEGCQVEKQKTSKIGFVQKFGASSILNNNYSFVSQEEDLTVRKSLQNPSNLSSFEKQSNFSNNSQSIQRKAKLFTGDSKQQLANQKPLMNHKHLLNRFQDYVATSHVDQNIQKQSSNTYQQKTPLGSVQGANSNRDSLSPPRNIGKSMDHSFEMKNALGSFMIDSGEMSQTKRMSSILLKNQPNQGNQPSFNYLPPKMSHKRQSSFGDNQQSAQKFIQSQYNKSAGGIPISNNQTKAQNQILINRSSESGQFNAPSIDANIYRDQNFKNVPPVSSIQMGIQNYSASAIYNAGQPSRQDAHMFMMHAHSHNIPKKGSNLEKNDYPSIAVQPFNTIYGDDLNSSHSNLSLSQQATLGIKNKVPTGLLGAPTKKLITLPKKNSEAAKIMLTESGSSQSLINKGMGLNQQQLSKKTSDVDIVLSYQV